MSINTLDDFRTYLKTSLGYPTINIEVKNAQIDLIINDCVDLFTRYNYSEGNFRDYIILKINAGTDEYSLSGQNVNDVYDWDISYGLVDGINTLFTPQNNLLQSDWVVKGQYPGAPNGAGGDSGQMMLASYDIGMMFLKEITNQFSKRYTIYYDSSREVLKISPTPKVDITGLLLVFKKEDAQYLYNNPLVKKLAKGKLMQAWGLNVGKLEINLPGGGKINWQMIIDKGEKMESESLADIKAESPGCDFFIG